MTIIQIKVSANNFTEAELLQKSDTAVQSCSGNVNFPKSQDVVKTLAEKTTVYGNKLAASTAGSKQAIAEKNTAMADLKLEYEVVGLSICAEVRGDKAKLATCGYEGRKHRAKKGDKKLPESVNIEVKPGKAKDEVEVGLVGKVDNFVSANFYQTRQDPAGSVPPTWTMRSSNARKYNFKNLELETKTWFKMEVVGTDSQVVESNIVLYIPY